LERDNQTAVGWAKPSESPAACSDLFEASVAAADAVPEPVPAEERAKNVTGAKQLHWVDYVAKKRVADQALAAFMNCVKSAPPTVTLIDGTIASCSMPGWFEPVDLLGETYVDGGVREILPLRGALDLGADQIFAIPASSIGVSPDKSFSSRPIGDILRRSLVEIMTDEIERDEVYNESTLVNEAIEARLKAAAAAARPGLIDMGGFVAVEGVQPVGAVPPQVIGHVLTAPITMIAPTIPIYDSIVVDPTLIQIFMDYGTMRAADVLGLKTSGEMQSADNITLYRVRKYELTSGGGDANELQMFKNSVASVVAWRQANALFMPAGAEMW
jgi:hypothetical protein